MTSEVVKFMPPDWRPDVDGLTITGEPGTNDKRHRTRLNVAEVRAIAVKLMGTACRVTPAPAVIPEIDSSVTVAVPELTLIVVPAINAPLIRVLPEATTIVLVAAVDKSKLYVRAIASVRVLFAAILNF